MWRKLEGRKRFARQIHLSDIATRQLTHSNELALFSGDAGSSSERRSLCRSFFAVTLISGAIADRSNFHSELISSKSQRRRIERGFSMGLWAEIRQAGAAKTDFGHSENWATGSV
jgi:hypothetical protein